MRGVHTDSYVSDIVFVRGVHTDSYVRDIVLMRGVHTDSYASDIVFISFFYFSICISPLSKTHRVKRLEVNYIEIQLN